MLTTVKDLLSSKKFMSAIIGCVVVIAGKLGFDLDEETLWKLVGLFGLHIGAQGAADVGKERAKADTGGASLNG